MERTYLFLSGRWDDTLVPWIMSQMVEEENVVFITFFFVVYFSLCSLRLDYYGS